MWGWGAAICSREGIVLRATCPRTRAEGLVGAEGQEKEPTDSAFRRKGRPVLGCCRHLCPSPPSRPGLSPAQGAPLRQRQAAGVQQALSPSQPAALQRHLDQLPLALGSAHQAVLPQPLVGAPRPHADASLQPEPHSDSFPSFYRKLGAPLFEQVWGREEAGCQNKYVCEQLPAGSRTHGSTCRVCLVTEQEGPLDTCSSPSEVTKEGAIGTGPQRGSLG